MTYLLLFLLCGSLYAVERPSICDRVYWTNDDMSAITFMNEEDWQQGQTLCLLFPHYEYCEGSSWGRADEKTVTLKPMWYHYWRVICGEEVDVMDELKEKQIEQKVKVKDCGW